MAKTRVAPAAMAVLNQANYFRPKRSKRSDGTIGDRRHRRSKSDHNPDRWGVVLAVDLTHDPARGVDAHGWARWLAARRDRRVKYIISNRQIWTPESGWRRYTGESPHTLHAHVSINKRYENDTSPWFEGWFYNVNATPAPPVPASPLPVRKALTFGERGRAVEILQWELAAVTGYQFGDEVGLFGWKTADSIIKLGKVMKKDWKGDFIGPDQWNAVDFLYMLKGHKPVLQ